MRLIDADALVKTFNEAQVEFDEYYKGIGRAKVITDNAPTVDTYTKDDLTREYLKGYNDCKDMNGRSQGEWIRLNERTKNPQLWYKCNLCGAYYSPTNFCPNCGANMRKERKNE